MVEVGVGDQPQAAYYIGEAVGEPAVGLVSVGVGQDPQALERLAVLNGLRDGLSPSRIAKQWSMPGRTVQRFKGRIYDYLRPGGRPSLEVAFVAVCDTVLMALKGERRRPLPTSLSGSASARLTQNRTAEISTPPTTPLKVRCALNKAEGIRANSVHPVPLPPR